MDHKPRMGRGGGVGAVSSLAPRQDCAMYTLAKYFFVCASGAWLTSPTHLPHTGIQTIWPPHNKWSRHNLKIHKTSEMHSEYSSLAAKAEAIDYARAIRRHASGSLNYSLSVVTRVCTCGRAVCQTAALNSTEDADRLEPPDDAAAS